MVQVQQSEKERPVATPGSQLVSWSKMSAGRRRAMRRSITSLIVILIAWELLGRYVLTNRLFFVPISSVAVAAVQMWQAGTLQTDIIASFSAVGYGMVLAIVAGIAIGILSGASQAFREYTDAIISALYATPLVAIAPILILWFGIGPPSKIAVVFLMAIFPILINTAAGVRNTDVSYIEVARSFGATRAQIIWKVMIPAAVPFVVTGIRLAIGRAIVGVVVGELFGARAGLGFLIFTAGQTFDVPQLFVGVITLAVLGMVLTFGMKWIENWIARWRRSPLED
jgi:NitT/TauT family transport system permease protein